MYSSWSRSTLRTPDQLEVDFVCAPPYHAVSFTGALLTICRGKGILRAVILDVDMTEPRIGTSIDLADPADKVLDVSWGPEGVFYLLRTDGATWRVESYYVEIERNGSKSKWLVEEGGMFTSPNFSVTSFAVQSRLGGLIFGCDTGELYHQEEELSVPRRLGRWCKGSVVITKVKRDRLIACISEFGKLSIALASNTAPHILELCPQENVATVSFSHELPTLAVGLAESPPRVRLFEYGWESNRVVATPTRDLVVFGPSLVEEERWLGGIRDIDFGTGSSVACLFHGRTEPVVFHATSGRRTTSGSANNRSGHLLWSPHGTSPSMSLLGASPILMQRNHQVGSKNHALTWVGSSLFYLNDQLEVCREGFSRHAAQAALYRNDAVRFAVLGPDFCSLLSLEGNPKWTRYDCPLEYISKQGPLTKVSIDDDKSRIAVAGRKGFCVFFAQSRRWKHFQSETMENRLALGGLFFLPTGHLGYSTLAADGKQHEIQIVDLTEQRLDVPPLFSTGPIPYGHPVAVDFVKTSSRLEMFVLFVSGLVIFEITTTSPKGFTMKSLGLFTRPPSVELGFVTHMTLVPSKLESVFPRVVLIDSAGRIVVWNIETHETTNLASAHRVADVWTKMDPTLGILIWTVVDRGLKLWLPSLDPQGELYQQSFVDVGFPEVGALPVGSDEDAFICFQSHLYDVRGSKSPVLHGVLSWLLRRGRDSLARRVLAERRFSKSVRLVRAALEDLLQGALLGENQVDVRKVVNLLGCVPFEIMAAVVARCARQIDPQLWEILFSIVGAPRDLFEQCLIRHDAASLEIRSKDLILIAAELLPIVDADKDDPAEGPATRAKMVLKRCEIGSTLDKEVRDYADKRGLDITFGPGEDADESFEFLAGTGHDNGGMMSSVIKFLSGF